MKTTKSNKKTFKTAYGYKKYGGDGRSYVPVANTSNDKRCSITTKINRDQDIVCPNGYKILASSNNGVIKMTCNCNVTFENSYSNLFTDVDAICDFCDHHNEVM
jgi:hypothetical protein